MSVGVGLEGQQELLARLAHARAGVLDLTDANRDMAQTVLRDAHAPRATGALDASGGVTVTAAGWGIDYGKPYAGYVHWGTRYLRARPWLYDAAHATEDRWMDQLTEHAQQLLDD